MDSAAAKAKVVEGAGEWETKLEQRKGEILGRLRRGR